MTDLDWLVRPDRARLCLKARSLRRRTRSRAPAGGLRSRRSPPGSRAACRPGPLSHTADEDEERHDGPNARRPAPGNEGDEGGGGEDERSRRKRRKQVRGGDEDDQNRNAKMTSFRHWPKRRWLSTARRDHGSLCSRVVHTRACSCWGAAARARSAVGGGGAAVLECAVLRVLRGAADAVGGRPYRTDGRLLRLLAWESEPGVLVAIAQFDAGTAPNVTTLVRFALTDTVPLQRKVNSGRARDPRLAHRVGPVA